ncbi:MAG: uracil phosphoribosyltransferase [Cytophagaceae bacterium]|nr:uracil phosphoribosyltransferase [Cytophagaceae bacterium]|tara:strand:+ start:42937 stop:43191 length:255 start_codon:yes stop_codon:yes gene_type:complete
MELKDFFYGIADLFVNVLFAPMDLLREWQLDTWWGANIFNWIFILIGFVALAYWLNQLKIFNDGDDHTFVTHSDADQEYESHAH